MARVVKIRGLTLESASLKRKMNSTLLLKFVQALASDQVMEEYIPQFQIRVNGKTRTLHSHYLEKLYSNIANDKRFYDPSRHPTKTWAYGTIHFE